MHATLARENTIATDFAFASYCVEVGVVHCIRRVAKVVMILKSYLNGRRIGYGPVKKHFYPCNLWYHSFCDG